LIKPDLLDEIDQAFENVDYNLKDAGGKGWSQVYKIVTYSTDIRPQHDRIVENLRKWMPDHQSVWTEVGVKQLGADAMHFEIEVEAYDEEGAEVARRAKKVVS
jgi:enamine deaminase RidA (YjgF/YER057c/UK114 family)